MLERDMYSTKYFSCKQEKLVAGVMGWRTVSASGARNFHPGDVKSSMWLGECKTHKSETPNICFYQLHWDKIITEAEQDHKDPVLIVDNGTQSIEGTWVMFDYIRCKRDFSYFFIDRNNCNELDDILSKKRVNIRFNHYAMLDLYRGVSRIKDKSGICSHVVIDIGSFGACKHTGICTLLTFSDMFGDHDL